MAEGARPPGRTAGAAVKRSTKRSGGGLRVEALALVAALVVVGCADDDAGGEPRGDGTAPVRSVILVTVDTLRADHLSAYGHERPTSPALDRFLEQGTRFRWAFSTSARTAPSHVSLMTGLYPSFNTVDVENARYPLLDDFVTLAELCRDAGLGTAAIVGNPVLDGRLGLDQGFETYHDDIPVRGLGHAGRKRLARDTVDLALSALDDLGDAPCFLWVHFQDPHGPYLPAPEALAALAEGPLDDGPVLEVGDTHAGRGEIPLYQAQGQERRLSEYVRRYDAEILGLDRELGRFFAALEDRGALQDTLVVFTADHGEAFGEDGYYLAHGHGLGLDQTRVPLAFVGPTVRARTVLDGAVSNLHVFATIVDALGLPADPGAGASLLAHLQQGTEPRGLTGFAEGVTQRAVFSGGDYVRVDRVPLSDAAFWSAVNPFTRAPRVPLGGARWTALAPGPDAPGVAAESRDDDHPLLGALEDFADRADRAREAMEAWRLRPRSLSAEEQAQLRALGYLK